jgi:lipoyl(octanoyl) transferase
MPDSQTSAVAWASSVGLTPYERALAVMETRAAEVAAGEASELVWLLQHPPLYTAGTSAKPEHLIEPSRLPVHETGRGGQFTYHGPGQRVVYVMLDVKSRFGGDVRGFVHGLEAWIVDALASLGVTGRAIAGRVGVWVDEPAGDAAKIAALGIRIRRGVSLHGISLNVAPDLADYAGIVPCGIADHGVTSLEKLGMAASMKDVDNALKVAFERRFGLVVAAADPLHAPSIIAGKHQ